MHRNGNNNNNKKKIERERERDREGNIAHISIKYSDSLQLQLRSFNKPAFNLMRFSFGGRPGQLNRYTAYTSYEAAFQSEWKAVLV